MKRKRDLFYDAYGRRNLDAPPKGAPANSSPSRPRAPRELRVSTELGIVLAVVMVVLIGTSYYFGTLGAKTAADHAELSTRDSAAQRAAESGSGKTPSSPGSFWSVRCLTRKWSTKEVQERVEADVKKAMAFIEQSGFNDVFALRDRARKEIYVYVGRSDVPSGLDSVLVRLKELSYGKDSFKDAFRDKVDNFN